MARVSAGWAWLQCCSEFGCFGGACIGSPLRGPKKRLQVRFCQKEFVLWRPPEIFPELKFPHVQIVWLSLTELGSLAGSSIFKSCCGGSTSLLFFRLLCKDNTCLYYCWWTKSCITFSFLLQTPVPSILILTCTGDTKEPELNAQNPAPDNLQPTLKLGERGRRTEQEHKKAKNKVMQDFAHPPTNVD